MAGLTAAEIPDIRDFVRQAPHRQQTALQATLQEISSEITRQQTDQAASDSTVAHLEQLSELSTQDGISADVSDDPEQTAELPPQKPVSAPDDVTMDLPASLADAELDSNLQATVAPTSSTADADDGEHFTWDATGKSERPVGNVPDVQGYQILGELGRGGMGVVYRARQRGLKRLVALKMVLSGGHASAEQLARFRAEAEAVAQLQHPNIVQIYDVGERDGLPFFALEFIDGQALDQLIDGQPQQPLRSAAIVEKLALAMHYAHEQGIVHRDLKPANILLTEYGIPKVTDFGLVKRLEADSSQTRTGTIMGTPSFMAPEQARCEREIGPAADTYALGAILYTMLTGRPPFMGPSALDTVMMVIRSEPVPPSRMQPKLARDIEIICMKCLQKDPEKRYDSAAGLAEDLRRFQAGEPILARPVGYTERVWRWCRRNPRVAVLTALAMMLALALMIGGPAAAVVINAQRAAAIEARTEAEASAITAKRAEGKAEAARQVADENAEVANQQRQLALETLNNVVTKVEEELRDRTELSDLRQVVLQLAMDGLERVSRSSETANFADRTIGAAHQRMGDILLRAGKAEEARGQYQRALAIFDKLLDTAEADLVRWNSALTHDGLGDVSRKQLEDQQLAREHYTTALEIRKLLQETSTSPQLKSFMIRASLANSFGRLSLLALDLSGQPKRSAELSELAIEQSEALMQELPDHPIPKQALAGAWTLYADALFRIGRADAARQFAEQAMELRVALLNDAPESVKARQDVAISNWTLGDFALYSGRPEAAWDYYQQAHSLRLELFEQDPDNPEMQEDLSNSNYRLGLAKLASAAADEAAPYFAQATQLRAAVLAADAENPGKQILLLQARARTENLAAVVDEVQTLKQQLYPNPATLARLAAVVATCCETSALAVAAAADDATSASGTPATTEAWQALALSLLEQAIAQGYDDAVALATDPDFAGIRHLDAFPKVP